MKKLIGAFNQLLSMRGLSSHGAISNEEMEIISHAGILLEDDKIIEIGNFDVLYQKAKEEFATDFEVIKIEGEAVVLPSFIDSHTHICYAGSRAKDYDMRVAGKTYLEIAASGGGIKESVTKTRAASQTELEEGILRRVNRQLAEGITTCEVKSGYGLSVKEELKMLRAIQNINKKHDLDLVATCLAAHIVPTEFDNQYQYLDYIVADLFPILKSEKLCNRIDIFVEESAFGVDSARKYLKIAKNQGFDLTIHADQFSAGGSTLACELSALSADHLEASGELQIKALAKSNTVATVLPGASLGLGIPFSPARKLLDAGCSLAIATDWNPGSAPMGDLLLQAALLGAYEKISAAETFAGITFRAAKALNLSDRGILAQNKKADFVIFPCADYREILYQQGKMKPTSVFKNGKNISLAKNQ